MRVAMQAHEEMFSCHNPQDSTPRLSRLHSTPPMTHPNSAGCCARQSLRARTAGRTLRVAEEGRRVVEDGGATGALCARA